MLPAWVDDDKRELGLQIIAFLPTEPGCGGRVRGIREVEGGGGYALFNNAYLPSPFSVGVCVWSNRGHVTKSQDDP